MQSGILPLSSYVVSKEQDTYVAKFKMRKLMLLVLFGSVVLLAAFTSFVFFGLKITEVGLIFFTLPVTIAFVFVFHELALRTYIFKKEGVFIKGIFIRTLVPWSKVEISGVEEFMHEDDKKKTFGIKIGSSIKVFTYSQNFWDDVHKWHESA